MPLKLSPAVFRREVERRLMDVTDVQAMIGVQHRQAVWKRVIAGTLPEPIVSYDRSYSLWDRDEIESFKPDTNKET